MVVLSTHDDQLSSPAALMEAAMQDIIKLCADNLRTCSKNHGIKLKASHAHELVAMFFGYKSKAALLVDTLYPVSNLPQATIIILAPIKLIDERRESLQNLPSDLPDTDTLREWFYAPLLAEKWFSSKFRPNYKELAAFLSDEYLRRNQMEKLYHSHIDDDLQVVRYDDCIHLTVRRLYRTPTEGMIDCGDIHEAIITTTILLKCVAADVGYEAPQISVQLERSKKIHRQLVMPH